MVSRGGEPIRLIACGKPGRMDLPRFSKRGPVVRSHDERQQKAGVQCLQNCQNLTPRTRRLRMLA